MVDSKTVCILIGVLLKLVLEAPAGEPAHVPPTNRELVRYEDGRVSMGCLYSIVVHADAATPYRETVTSALGEIDRIDRLMSHYRPDSELSRINREAATSATQVDAELFEFLSECLRYSRQSEGAFDVTVGPLMKSWGFFRGEGRMPSTTELTEARGRTGYQHVVLDPQARTIFFKTAGVELDLGGIAKGYAVDLAMQKLKEGHIHAALLSAGGSTISALGAPPGELGWQIELQDPIDRRKIARSVVLKNQTLSVSGNSEKFFTVDGQRYSHILDPRTGRPVQGVLSVVVINDSGTVSDALDNVFYVLGVERSRQLAQRWPGTRVMFFLPDATERWKLVTLDRSTATRR